MATHVSKQSQVAHAALIELNSACELFEHAARHGGRAVKFLVSTRVISISVRLVCFGFFHPSYLPFPRCVTEGLFRFDVLLSIIFLSIDKFIDW